MNGGASMHFSKARGHRSLNLHPTGGFSNSGGPPGIPVSRLSAYLTPTSGNVDISIFVYGCSGADMMASLEAFSANCPAYMIRIVSAISYSTEMSCVCLLYTSDAADE